MTEVRDRSGLPASGPTATAAAGGSAEKATTASLASLVEPWDWLDEARAFAMPPALLLELVEELSEEVLAVGVVVLKRGMGLTGSGVTAAILAEALTNPLARRSFSNGDDDRAEDPPTGVDCASLLRWSATGGV